MPSKKKSTKGGAIRPQGKGKNGQPRPNGKPRPGLPGGYARFTADISAGAEVRARAPKIQAFGTYGKLSDHLAKAFADGRPKVDVAGEHGVTAARVNELAWCLGLEKPEATGEICVDRPTVGPGGEVTIEAPRKGKAKA